MGHTHRVKGGTHRRSNPDAPDEVFGKGDPISPSEAELRLENKFEPIGGGRARPRPTVTAEHSYAGLPMASRAALAAAIDGDLDPAALEDVEPSGETGYGAAQVREAVEASDGGGDDEEDE